MHRDGEGRLHLAVAVVGAWSRTLDYDLTWLNGALPMRYPRTRRIVRWDNIWYSQVQALLAAEGTRKEPVQLHVSAMTGTIWSEHLVRYLMDHADGVVFAAETDRWRLEATQEAHGWLEAWRARREQPVVVYQFDESANTGVDHVGEVEQPLSPDELRAALDCGEHPWFASKAVEARDVRQVFRAIVDLLLEAEARGVLVDRPLPAPIERL